MPTPHPRSPVQGPAPIPAATSGWQLYTRLVGYAWQYKARLLLALCFAFVVAASLGSLLFGMVSSVDLIFFEETRIEGEDGDDGEDLADAYALSIGDAQRFINDRTGLRIEGFDAQFLSAVLAAREDKMYALKLICGVALVLAALMSAALFVQVYFAGSVGASVSTDLGQAMYENLMKQSVGFFELQRSGEVIARFTNDIFAVNTGLTNVLVKLMREPIMLIVLLGAALYQDIWLTVVGIGVLPTVALVLIRTGKKTRRSVTRSLEKIGSVASVVGETVKGITIVQGFGMERYEIGRVQREMKKLRHYLVQRIRIRAAATPIIEYILILGIMGFVLFGAHRVEKEELKAYQLSYILIAIIACMDPVRKLAKVNVQVQASLASAERIFEFIDRVPDIVEARGAVTLRPLAEHLHFDNVHFSYKEDVEVLRGIDLTVKKGEMVALVGFSGAGKSTLVKLIPRFYDVDRGAVKIDGTDIRECTFESLRGQISIVTQDTILFAESIRANICFGDAGYTEEDVECAARAAHAHEFIAQLPEGYDTVLGEGGVGLSGGQRQRIAIARAFIKDPSILILDEATSSLDSESEQFIQEALGQFVAGRTTLVIAHRLSTVQRADRIVVLDAGSICEEGTHAELLAHSGLYKRLYETQFGTQVPAK